MKRLKYPAVFVCMLLVISATSFNVRAQILKPVKWMFGFKKIGKGEGEITLQANIDKGWHIYAQTLPPGDGPIATSFMFEKSKQYSLMSLKPTEISKPKIELDPTWNKRIGYYESKAMFQQRVKLSVAQATVKGVVEYMVCDNQRCLPPTKVPFEVTSKN